MADQVVGHLAEVVGGEDGVAELVEGVGVDLLDGRDQVVEPDGVVLRAGCVMPSTYG